MNKPLSSQQVTNVNEFATNVNEFVTNVNEFKTLRAIPAGNGHRISSRLVVYEFTSFLTLIIGNHRFVN